MLKRFKKYKQTNFLVGKRLSVIKIYSYHQFCLLYSVECHRMVLPFKQKQSNIKLKHKIDNCFHYHCKSNFFSSFFSLFLLRNNIYEVKNYYCSSLFAFHLKKDGEN